MYAVLLVTWQYLLRTNIKVISAFNVFGKTEKNFINLLKQTVFDKIGSELFIFWVLNDKIIASIADSQLGSMQSKMWSFIRVFPVYGA